MKKYFIFKNKSILGSSKENFSWLECISPSREEMDHLVKDWDLPLDYILDVNDPYELPRSEGLNDERPNLFVLSYPVQLSRLKYVTRVVSVVVVNDFVITIRNEDSPIFSILKEEGFRKIQGNESKENFVLELAWLISKAYIDCVKNLNENILELEDKMRSSSNTEFLYEIIDVQRSLTNLQMATRENGPVIESIFEMEILYRNDYRDDLLRDLQVENKQARIMIEKSTTTLNKLTDLYSNVINNNLNGVVKILTVITILLTIPTIIGGLWGMNVPLPLANNPHAFSFLILSCLAISILTLLYLRKKKYI